MCDRDPRCRVDFEARPGSPRARGGRCLAAARCDRAHLSRQGESLVGSYTVLEECPESFKLKRIEVAPSARLSLQSHAHRSEHWVVVSGSATVSNGDEGITVKKSQSTYIPIGTKHRLENRSNEPLHIVEIQVDEYLGAF